jgi:hypothetical protein
MMKTLKLLTAGFVVLFASMAANASTYFVPTDGDFNFAAQIGSFDIGVFDNDAALAAASPYLAVSTGDRVTADGPPATTLTNATAGGSLDITGGDFIIGAYTAATGWVGGTGLMTGDNIYTVSFTDTIPGASVVVDVSTVPVPAAAWLFGSGLLGLVGVARRRRV